MEKKKNGILLSVLGIISLLLITVGVTYAFFTYAKQGTTENSLTTGTITFIYEEVEAQGAGISISDAYPISDTVGKAQTGSGNVFNFTIKSQTTNATSIPYIVTARMKADSTLDQSAVKIYLTEVNGANETELLLNTYDKLGQVANVADGVVEKQMYTDTVPANSANYKKDFRLRMWIPDSIDFSPTQDEQGNDIYPYNGKTFTITVNVYANAEVVSESTGPVTMTSATSLSIGDSVEAIDGSKWHVLEASAAGVDTVVLLSDYNLNSDGSYNTECGRDINATYACSTMAFDSDNTNTYDETDSNNIGYFIKNTYEPLVASSLLGTTNVTLATLEQITAVDGVIVNFQSSWLTTTNYWLKTESVGTLSNVCYVDGSVSSSATGGAINQFNYGARPVITTLKSNLLAE